MFSELCFGGRMEKAETWVSAGLSLELVTTRLYLIAFLN